MYKRKQRDYKHENNTFKNLLSEARKTFKVGSENEAEKLIPIHSYRDLF